MARSWRDFARKLFNRSDTQMVTSPPEGSDGSRLRTKASERSGSPRHTFLLVVVRVGIKRLGTLPGTMPFPIPQSSCNCRLLRHHHQLPFHMKHATYHSRCPRRGRGRSARLFLSRPAASYQRRVAVMCYQSPSVATLSHGGSAAPAARDRPAFASCPFPRRVLLRPLPCRLRRVVVVLRRWPRQIDTWRKIQEICSSSHLCIHR